MKSPNLHKRIIVSFKPAILGACLLLLADRVSAQTLTTLHSFTGASDGANPTANLVLSGNILYGTTFQGGNSQGGTVFALPADAGGLLASPSILHSFTGGSDGAGPIAGLILSGGTLYGTTIGGTVFAVNVDGTGFNILHSFIGGDGSSPYGGLVLSGNTLYGTAEHGGSSGNGTLFAVNTDGTGFRTLHSFTGGDGANPYSGLILSGNTLYGTATAGGSSGNGTVFSLNLDGTGFTTLHSFTAPDANTGINNDGSSPYAGLVLLGASLYGTATTGGSWGGGTVFKLNIDGTGFTTLYSFSGSPSDGSDPVGSLILSGNTLYGTTRVGGISGDGTVFAVNTDGTGFTILYNFTQGFLQPPFFQPPPVNSDGAFPQAGLILSGDTLYGTAVFGGTSGQGTVFQLTRGGIDSLISLVQAFNFAQGIENSLDAKLQDAQAAIVAAKSGDFTSACGLFEAFINEVQAQTGKKITTGQASQLIAAANQIKAVVGCP